MGIWLTQLAQLKPPPGALATTSAPAIVERRIAQAGGLPFTRVTASLSGWGPISHALAALRLRVAFGSSDVSA